MKTFFLPIFLVALVLTAFRTQADEVVLFADGQWRGMIVLPATPDKLERQAAGELIEHIKAIAGEGWNLRGLPDFVVKEIRLGELAEEHRRELMARSNAPGSFALVVGQEAITIGGVEPIGTLYGVYELLEQLGVRWYMPGDLGRVLPIGDRVALPVQTTLQSPSFISRAVGGNAAVWNQRMRLGGVAPASILSFPAPAPFDEQPEYYALVGGERSPRQLCVSNPAVLEAMVLVMRDYFAKRPEAPSMPVSNHGDGHCECAGCRALDPPERLDTPFTGGINLNDRYVWFCNQLLESVAAELPDKRLVLTVCTPQFQAPTREIGHARLDVMAWANGFCRLHGVNNPACPQRQEVLRMEQEWVQKLQGHFYERTNWGNIAGPGLPLPAVHRYREDFPAYFAAGVKGVRGADYSHLISQLPSSYIGARLLWNHETDVDALLSDFYTRFYGPAEAAMRAYHELMETTMRDAPYHTGTAIDFPRIYTAPMRSAARAALDRARAAATEAPFSTRIAAIALNLDYLDTFCEMIAARDRADFGKAHEALLACREIIGKLQNEYDPPLLNRSFTPNYLDLFFGRAIEEAWRKTSDEGRLVAALQPVWEFRLDPQGIGEAEQWYTPGHVSDAWRPQATWTSSWVSEGLGEYEGLAWYRQTIELPEQPGPLMLWIGGVDEEAEVWLNGKRLGSHTGAFRSFEFPIDDAAVRGGKNLVVIKIGNHTLDEVGTGGLLAPVIIHAPGK